MRFGSTKHEYRVRRRFFQYFQKCVKSVYAQHVNFVNNINFIFSVDGRKRRLFLNISYIVNAIVACGVKLYNINSRLIRAVFAFQTRITVIQIRTIYRASKYLCGGGFARTARTAKKISMTDLPRFYLVF